MDGFDDLLTHSKTALDENPFEDPFAGHRSSSPDPWASFSHQTSEAPSDIFSPASPQHNDRIEPSGSPTRAESKLGQIVVSPLEQSSSASDRSFPSLALGGEFPGGWQPSQVSWANEAPPASAVDLDDDEPIAKLQKSSHEANKAASTPPLIFWGTLSTHAGCRATGFDLSARKSNCSAFYYHRG
jgi:hypothetical protein